MKRAPRNTNLGWWAELMQASIPYWPYSPLPSLRTVRRKAHTNEWYVHVPPPHYVVYVCINLRTGMLYVGQTSKSPVQRLRKHHTDARAGTDCATFHTLLLTTDIGDWVTIPVQYCASLFQTGLAERAWWSDLRHWAVNDIPPGISENDTSNSKRAYITGTVLHVLQELQELREARQHRDTQRVKALQAFLRDTASQLSLPFHVSGVIVIPNLSRCQKTVIFSILRRALSESQLKAYERQALRNTVRIVRSNPHTVRSLFQSHTMTQSRLLQRPHCQCAIFRPQAAQFGRVLDIDGHVALLPVNFRAVGHDSLRPNYPVPVPGSHTRDKAITGIKDFCRHLQVLVPDLDLLLPPSLFPESGNLLLQIRKLSRFLAKFQYIRVVDKGADEMWGFCPTWVWDKVEEFMRAEKFINTRWQKPDWDQSISAAVQAMALQRNPQGRMCVLDVLAKAKSLKIGVWVFRGISASPAPILQRKQLRLAARAFTCMLRMLQTEIVHNFQFADVKQVSGWFRFVSGKGARSITELCASSGTTFYSQQVSHLRPRLTWSRGSLTRFHRYGAWKCCAPVLTGAHRTVMGPACQQQCVHWGSA